MIGFVLSEASEFLFGDDVTAISCCAMKHILIVPAQFICMLD
jgi:hypothetical protein